MHIGSLTYEYKVEETKKLTPADVYGSVDVSRYLGPDEEFTGEFRPPVYGERALILKGDGAIYGISDLEATLDKTKPRLIVRKKPLAFNQKWRIADGEQPRTTKGFEFYWSNLDKRAMRDDRHGGIEDVLILVPAPGFTPVPDVDYADFL